MKKFGRDDLFINRVKTHPYFDFLVYDTQMILNGKTRNEEELEIGISGGYIDLYESNVGRTDTNAALTYPFVYKDGTRTTFKTISLEEFNLDDFGEAQVGVYPLSASISRHKYAADALGFNGVPKPFFTPLKNTLNWYSNLSKHYVYSSSLMARDYASSSINLIEIPSIFYGTAIKKGSLDLRFYVSGALAGRLQDINRNGELIETTGSQTGSVAGVALYSEGFIVLTGSWAMNNHLAPYSASTDDNPKWIHYGAGIGGEDDDDDIDVGDLPSSSYSLSYQGTQFVPTITMLAHADKGEFNHSNNPTFVKFGEGKMRHTSSVAYIEDPEREIKNTVQIPYADPTGSFKKQTWISKVGVYDKNRNLIGVAQLANPVLKTESRDFTFKLKLDL